ncbi:MAG: helix-turn-helix transcriptional regulator [Lachnospiraceae bacterium]|nr:helix-turn-helix transcriptional regulator [Lachnospiraceae bacterium]
MFHKNFKAIRKDRGFSQEQMAVRLNVVRQTVSKWEQGLSVPDAEMLIDIAEVLNVSVSDLLGTEIEVEEKDNSLEMIATELAKLNELLVLQHQKSEQTKKKIIDAVIIVFFLIFLCCIYESWGDTWNEFGRNLYHFLND